MNSVILSQQASRFWIPFDVKQFEGKIDRLSLSSPFPSLSVNTSRLSREVLPSEQSSLHLVQTRL